MHRSFTASTHRHGEAIPSHSSTLMASPKLESTLNANRLSLNNRARQVRKITFRRTHRPQCCTFMQTSPADITESRLRNLSDWLKSLGHDPLGLQPAIAADVCASGEDSRTVHRIGTIAGPGGIQEGERVVAVPLAAIMSPVVRCADLHDTGSLIRLSAYPCSGTELTSHVFVPGS